MKQAQHWLNLRLGDHPIELEKPKLRVVFKIMPSLNPVFWLDRNTLLIAPSGDFEIALSSSIKWMLKIHLKKLIMNHHNSESDLINSGQMNILSNRKSLLKECSGSLTPSCGCFRITSPSLSITELDKKIMTFMIWAKIMEWAHNHFDQADFHIDALLLDRIDPLIGWEHQSKTPGRLGCRIWISTL